MVPGSVQRFRVNPRLGPSAMTAERLSYWETLPGRQSAALAQPAAFERDDLAPGRRIYEALLRRLGEALLELLGDPEQALATLHLGPHVLGMHACRHPEHD